MNTQESQDSLLLIFRGGVKFGRSVVLTFSLLALMIGVGCSPKSRENSKEKAKSYDIRGEILGLAPERRILIVHHEEIPGYMPEMTMEFGVGDADLGLFKSGQHITARMREVETGEFILEGIRVIDSAKDSSVEFAARKLREDTFVLGKNAFREIGEVAPSFTLYNQNGEVVSFSQFRGKRVVINFIFTRCPVATMCPAARAHDYVATSGTRK